MKSFWRRRWWLVVAIALAIVGAWLLVPNELTVTFLRIEEGELGKRWAVWRLGNAMDEIVFCRPGVYQVRTPEGWRDYPISSNRHITVNSRTDWDVATTMGAFDELDGRTSHFRVSFVEQRYPPRWIRSLAKKVPWLIPAKVLQSRAVAVWSEVVTP